jgi:hypothetical protein
MGKRKQRKNGSLMYPARPHERRATRAARADVREFYCEFCRRRQPDETPDIWRCPFGCAASQPKCKECFTPRLNRPPKKLQEILLTWHVRHVSGCRAPEPRQASEAPAHIYEDFSSKSLMAFAASLAVEVQPSAVLHRIVAGERIPAAELLERVTRINGTPPDARSPAERVVLSALWTAMIMTVKDGDWPRRVAQHAWATKYYAIRYGLSVTLIAELEIRSQLQAWTKTRYARDEVVDAATAAWVVGERRFARNLVKREKSR